jgi:ribosomal protein L19
MLIIKNIEKKRLKNNKKKINYIKYPTIVRGDFIIIWYINREKEKGLIRFQFNRGLCIDIKYKKYNSTFIIRSIIDGISVEQHFFYYSLNNIYIYLKKNTIRYYRLNKLYYLRNKKNKQSKFII